MTTSSTPEETAPYGSGPQATPDRAPCDASAPTTCAR